MMEILLILILVIFLFNNQGVHNQGRVVHLESHPDYPIPDFSNLQIVPTSKKLQPPPDWEDE